MSKGSNKMQKALCVIILVCSVLCLAACDLSSIGLQPTAVVQSVEPTNTPTVVPNEPAPIAPADQAGSEVTLERIVYNLPPAILTSSTGLYPSPNRGELIVQAEIPAGEAVYVMGRNGTSSHLRVVWSTGVGWVPVSFTDYHGKRDRLESLPVFTREPPRCAVPLTTQFALSSEWTSDRQQRIAVVVDLFRSRYGDFPSSYLSLTVNGKTIESTRRQIVERGQFSLKDVVFSLPGYVQQGDTVGYLLETTSAEPLTFMATIFSVPDGCVWDTK